MLAVPVEQRRATMHLDTVCTMVDVDAVVMYPPIADTLIAYAVTADGRARARSRSWPPPPTRWASTGCASSRPASIRSPPSASSGTTATTPWPSQPRLVVAYERNVETNARLEDAGIEVVRIAGSELGSGRGGPRCMSCPVARD